MVNCFIKFIFDEAGYSNVWNAQYNQRPDGNVLKQIISVRLHDKNCFYCSTKYTAYMKQIIYMHTRSIQRF